VSFNTWTGSGWQYWAYDSGGNTWVNRPTVSGASYRWDFAFDYDTANDRFYMFGGTCGGGCFFGETWRYEPATNSWSAVSTTGTPTPRWGHKMAFHAPSGLFVLFGGVDGSGYLADTWTYDSSTATWTLKAPPLAPAARQAHRMVYDAASGRIVLFGGSSAAGLRDDTWAYDPFADVWTNLSGSVRPTARYSFGLANDVGASKLVLFGGSDGTAGLGDTWTFPGAEPIATLGSVLTFTDPGLTNGVRYYYRVAARNAEGVGPASNEVSAQPDSCFSGADTWTDKSPGDRPSPRDVHAMAYDSESDRIILFGGHADAGGVRGDTWAYDFDANSWAQMTPGVAPSARSNPAMAYDSQSDRIVLFGGHNDGTDLDETWTYNFNTNTWTDMGPAVRPSARIVAAMAYDSQSDRVILFGGYAGPRLGDTWAYDFNTNAWTNMGPASAPSPRSGASMAYDSQSDRIVLFGGHTGAYSSETWTYDYDINTWSNPAPTPAPPARAEGAVAYDSQSDRTLIFAGEVLGTADDDLWAYDVEGNSWAEQSPATNPTARYGVLYAMAYDSQSDRTVLFGGRSLVLNRDLDDTWAYDLPAAVCPSPPTVAITGPPAGSLYAVGEYVTFTGEFTDPDITDTHSAQWTFTSASSTITIEGTVTESGGSGTVSDAFAFVAAGVYRVSLSVTDDDGGTGTADMILDLDAFVVVYDPNGGFVTGGGWITSAPGAYVPSPLLTGKATFGFVAKYKKGASVPTGQTEFQFKVGDLNFHSTSYDWLVCGGPKCKFKGEGTINGVGTYGFMLSAIDGDLPGGGGADKIRMKIWDLLTGQVVYDSQLGGDEFEDPTTVLGGGSIVIHKG